MRLIPSRPWGRATCAILASFAVMTIVSARPAAAQGSGQGFLFRSPVGALTFRGGLDRATAGSDVFSFVIDELTVDKRDFRAATIGADVSFIVAPRLAVLVGMSFSRTHTLSEFRDWLDNDDRPIEQATTLVRLPITGSVKFWVTSPGRAVGRRAWVPARYAPYVGAGAGALRYRFAQVGDFIDFDTLRVFADGFDSKGWTPTAHGFAGLDVSLTPHTVFNTEGRYEWARSDLSRDFAGFDPIDLSGFKMTAGFTFRY